MEISKEEYKELITASIHLDVLMAAILGSMTLTYDGERVAVEEKGQILLAANLVAPEAVNDHVMHIIESDGGKQKAHYQELIRKQKEEQNGDQ